MTRPLPPLNGVRTFEAAARYLSFTKVAEGLSVTPAAVGPQAGRKSFTLQTVPARQEDSDNRSLAKTAGFSPHAGVAAKAHQRRKLERLCRYIVRPAVATDRLALTPQGNVRYDVKGFTNVASAGCAGATTLNTPCRDGTAHIILEPLDVTARLGTKAANTPGRNELRPARGKNPIRPPTSTV